MRALFVDTAGWMACADASDAEFARACAARDDAIRRGRMLLTTDYVMDETLTLIRVRLGLKAAEAWWKQIEGSSRLRWEWIDAARAERARQAFFHQKDKAYSFTDCTSMVVMHELKLKQALTTDADFARMGFEVLPGLRAARRR
jgi:uncharacterized protein